MGVVDLAQNFCPLLFCILCGMVWKPPIQRCCLFPYHLNLGFPCDLIWQTECGRSGRVSVLSLGFALLESAAICASPGYTDGGWDFMEQRQDAPAEVNPDQLSSTQLAQWLTRHMRTCSWDKPKQLTHKIMNQINGYCLKLICLGIFCYTTKANECIGGTLA